MDFKTKFVSSSGPPDEKPDFGRAGGAGRTDNFKYEPVYKSIGSAENSSALWPRNLTEEYKNADHK